MGKPGGEVHSGLAFLLGRCHGKTEEQGSLGYLQKGAQNDEPHNQRGIQRGSWRGSKGETEDR